MLLEAVAACGVYNTLTLILALYCSRPAAGRRFEMVFEYLPTANVVTEQFWMFRIPEQSIEVMFLLVGNVAEPRVAFDRPALNFEKVLVGGKVTQKLFLVNNEHLPFEFRLDRASYEGTAENVSRPGAQFYSRKDMAPKP